MADTLPDEHEQLSHQTCQVACAKPDRSYEAELYQRQTVRPAVLGVDATDRETACPVVSGVDKLVYKQGVYHVIPSLHGGWEVKKSGASRASRHFEHKQDAVKYGRKMSQNQQAQLVIHRQ